MASHSNFENPSTVPLISTKYFAGELRRPATGFPVPAAVGWKNVAEGKKKQDVAWRWEEIQLHKWDHYTTHGKTFMIGAPKERHLQAIRQAGKSTL